MSSLLFNGRQAIPADHLQAPTRDLAHGHQERPHHVQRQGEVGQEAALNASLLSMLQASIDGLRFNNAYQVQEYSLLRERLRKGEIKAIRFYEKHVLAPLVIYRPTFTVYYSDGRIEIIDIQAKRVKGNSQVRWRELKAKFYNNTNYSFTVKYVHRQHEKGPLA